MSNEALLSEMEMFNVVFSLDAFQAPALKVNVASPVKDNVGVVAFPILELPTLTHEFAPKLLVNFQLGLSYLMSPEAIPPLQRPSLPPVVVQELKCSSKIVVVSCPHALLPNTKEATISRQRRDIVIPFLQKSFSIIIIIF